VRDELKKSGVITELSESLNPMTDVSFTLPGYDWTGRAPGYETALPRVVDHEFGKTWDGIKRPRTSPPPFLPTRWDGAPPKRRATKNGPEKTKKKKPPSRNCPVYTVDKTVPYKWSE
jgi:hypothetical protein